MKGKQIFYLVMVVILVGLLTLVLCSRACAKDPVQAQALEAEVSEPLVAGATGSAAYSPADGYTYYLIMQRNSTTYLVLWFNPVTFDQVKDYLIWQAAYSSSAPYKAMQLILSAGSLNCPTYYRQFVVSVTDHAADQVIANVVGSQTGYQGAQLSGAGPFITIDSSNAFVIQDNMYYGINKYVVATNIPDFKYATGWGNNAGAGTAPITSYDTCTPQNTPDLLEIYYNASNSFSQDAYDEGYADGLAQGTAPAKYGCWYNADVTAVYFRDAPSFKVTNPAFDLYPLGIGFSSISQALLGMYTQASESVTGTLSPAFVIEADLQPFKFTTGYIVATSPTEFLSLTFYDEEGTSYSCYLSNNRTRGVYNVMCDDAVDVEIVRMVIKFSDYNDYLYHGVSLISQVNEFEDETFKQFYDFGDIEGYDDGYTDGYNKGVSVAAGELTGWDAVSGAFESIFEALSIKVFGFFSMGDVLGIVFIFGVVFFVFKLIRG